MIKKLTLVLLFSLCWANFSLADEYSGMWWDTSKQGQGLSIVQNGASICGAWYLYDSSGNDMWLVFTGSLDSSNTVTAELLRYTGPPLGTTWDTNKLVSSVKGSITITFNSSESASMHYSLGDITGDLNLVPFANDSASFYWDPQRPGQGIGLFTEGSKIYAVWYLYDENGEDMWLTTPGDLSLTSLDADLYQFTGPPLGAVWTSTPVQSTKVGNATLSFPDLNSITLTYSVHGQNGQLNVVPFTCSEGTCSGTYSGTYTGSAPVSNADPDWCGYFATVSLVICDSSVTGNAIDNFGEEYSVSGSVDSNGNVTGTIYEGFETTDTGIGTFTGTISGSSATGTWQDSYGCHGTFSVTKK